MSASSARSNAAMPRSESCGDTGRLPAWAASRTASTNALAESVFATLECELFDQQPGGRFATRREAKLAVFAYLETFYNLRRRHSALGQRSPAAFEARYALERPTEHTVTTAA